MGKRPAFQFYPADWRKDAELQSCSVTARGLWHEAMCIMHECEPYGELRVNGKPMIVPQLARLVGMTVAECNRAWAELESAGVFSVAADGAFYSRRMVRDEAVRNSRAAGGAAGAAHGSKGAEHGAKGGRPRNATGVKKPPLYPPPSSSSSASTDTTSLRSVVEREAPQRKSKRGLPEGFPFDENLRWARDYWLRKGRADLCSEISDEAAKFRDHHTGQDTRSADWSASWRTWARNAMNFTKRQGNGRNGQPTAHDKFFAGAAELIAEYDAEERQEGRSAAPFDTGRPLLPS